MNRLLRWFRPAARARRPVSCRPRLEALESRLVLSSERPAAINYFVDGQLHVFQTHLDGHLYDYHTPDNANWFWTDLGAPGGSDSFHNLANPAATVAYTSGYSRLHAYLLSVQGNLYDCWYDGSWHLDNHGGPSGLTGDVSVVSYWVNGGTIDQEHVFVGDRWGHVWDHWWDGGNWHWTVRGNVGASIGAPAAIAWWNASFTDHHVHVFATDVNGILWDVHTDDAGDPNPVWSTTNLGGGFRNSSVDVGQYWGDNQVHVFVSRSDFGDLQDFTTTDGSTFQWHWRGGTGFTNLSRPGVASYWDGNEFQIHAYVIGGDGNLYDCYTNDGQHFNFDNHSNPGTPLYIWGGGPGAAVGPSNTLHVLLYSNDGHLWDHWWNGSWNWTDLGPTSGRPSIASPPPLQQGDAPSASVLVASLATPTPAPLEGAVQPASAMPASLVAGPARQPALDLVFSSPISPLGSSMSRWALRLAAQEAPAANPMVDPFSAMLPAN
jgi:hypothetical protein